MYLTQGVHRALQQHPDRLATVDGDRTRTYERSAERIAKLATEKLGLVPPQQGQVLMVHQPGSAPGLARPASEPGRHA